MSAWGCVIVAFFAPFLILALCIVLPNHVGGILFCAGIGTLAAIFTAAITGEGR